MPRHTPTGHGSNSQGNNYTSYNGGSSFRYSNSNGSSFYDSGSGKFYSPGSSGNGSKFYESTGGQRSYQGGDKR